METRTSSPSMDEVPTPAKLGRLFRAATRIMMRDAAETCIATQEQNTCEKPVASSNITLIVIVSTSVAFIVILGCTLLLLHFRRKKIYALEDKNDRYNLSDYGLDALETANTKKTKRGAGSTKGFNKDNGNSSLGRMQQRPARESVQSLTHSIRTGGENPFGSTAEIVGNDAMSVRSMKPQQAHYGV